MFRILILFVTFVGLIPNCVKAQKVNPAIKVDLVYLSSDYLQGRMTGEKGGDMAAEYIALRCEELGLTPYFNGSFFQEVECTIASNPHLVHDVNAKQVTANNVAAYIYNNAKHSIVIGAHYDHIGKGGTGSRAMGSEEIHNGADDNASGIAALLEIASQLKDHKNAKYNYLFVAFTAEELGLIGSKIFVESPPFTDHLSGINCMLNLDMVGRMDSLNSIVANGVGTSARWKEILDKSNRFQIELTTGESGVGPSDHTSFYFVDIPVLHFYTGLHEDYHKPSDDAHLINFQGIQRTADYLVQIVKDLDDFEKLPFSKTKDDSDKKVAAFKVTLGVLPDYTGKVEGMRIDGVIEGRPAAIAGMMKGDVIIKMGEQEVKDIYQYMDALATFKIGDSAQVLVLRDKEEVSLNVKFIE